MTKGGRQVPFEVGDVLDWDDWDEPSSYDLVLLFRWCCPERTAQEEQRGRPSPAHAKSQSPPPIPGSAAGFPLRQCQGWLQNMFYADLRNSSAENPRKQAIQSGWPCLSLLVPSLLGVAFPGCMAVFIGFGLDISALISLTTFGCQRQKLGAGSRIGAF